MYKSMLITHQIVVTIFFLIYVIKTVLLLSNKTDVLAKFTKSVKVPEMIVSFLFLATGIYLLTQVAEIKTLMVVKILLVALSIPVAIIGFKKGNKIMAALSLLMITTSYGLAEMSRKNKPAPVVNATNPNGGIDGKIVYMNSCALCHGADGKLGASGAADLSLSKMEIEEMKSTILNGKGAMQKVALTPEQAVAVAAYVETDIKGK